MTALAFVGALGMLLIFTAFFNVEAMAPSTRLGRKFEEMGVMPEKARITLLRRRPWLDRLLGSTLEGWVERLLSLLPSEEDRKKLLRAAFPPPYSNVNDLYAWKVLLSLGLFLMGLVFSLLVGKVGFLLLALGLALFGFYLPDIHLSQAANRRKEEMLVEMSYVLDRMAIQLAAGRTLPVVITQLAESPGGWFTLELKQIARDYNSGVALVEAIEAMAERNDVDELTRLASRLVVSIRRGTNLADALQVMAKTTRERVESMILSRGLLNSVLMPIPIGLIVMLGVGLAIMAPGLFLAMRNL